MNTASARQANGQIKGQTDTQKTKKQPANRLKSRLQASIIWSG
jgi:hypothetical protein